MKLWEVLVRCWRRERQMTVTVITVAVGEPQEPGKGPWTFSREPAEPVGRVGERPSSAGRGS